MAVEPRHLASPPDPRRRVLTLVVLALVLAGGLVAALATASEQPGEVAATVTSTTSTTSGPPVLADAPSTGSHVDPVAPASDRLGSGAAVTLAFVGDMNFEGPNRARLDADPSTAVGPFAAVLRSADLAVGNLETAIAVGGTRADKQFTFRAPPSAITALRAAGLDVMSMANNHGLDFGLTGLLETLAAARTQPDHFIVGIGAEEAEAYAPFTRTVKGQRISVIGATQVLDDRLISSWTATPDHGGLASAKRVDRLTAEVRKARAASDTVIVFLHWGVEKRTCPTGDQQRLAAALANAGADVIVGSHAHRLQGGGRMGEAVVHYGLGNFLFKENSAEGARTGVFEVTVTGRRVDGYRWVPGRIAGSVPRPLDGAEADRELAYWESLRECAALEP